MKKTQPKTVRVYSKKISDEEFARMSDFFERYGSHHELTRCKKCGEMNANIAAAKNILSRLTDEEITLYTPYKRVKEILVSRIKEA